jgi:hypothetical protein
VSDPDQVKAAASKLRLKVPGLKGSVGAGDIVHKITDALGMEHCSECEKRKARMNRFLRFEAAMEDEG